MSEQKITIDLPDAAAIGAEVATVSGGESTPTIRDDAERMAVSERIGQCKRVLRQINELFAGAKKAASDAHKAVCAAERKLSDPVDAWIRQAGQKVLAYDAEKDRVRRAEEARLQAEAQVFLRNVDSVLEYIRSTRKHCSLRRTKNSGSTTTQGKKSTALPRCRSRRMGGSTARHSSG